MKPVVSGLLAFLLTPFAIAGNMTADEDIEKARETTAAFASALKTELVTAMQAGGPLTAIGVCNTRAPVIAAEVSGAKGMSVSRVSVKNRNPENAPNAWQAAVLETFEARKLAGENPSSLTWSETVDLENGKEFRFMKAIPTAAICLQCHGQAIAPPVAEELASLYPEDKATGYREGDIRGAFVVTQKTN